MITKEHGAAAASDVLDKYLQQFLHDNPKSQTQNERASTIMPAGITRAVHTNKPFPLYADAGHDCYLTSIDGHTYVDFVSQYFAAMFGHSHPDIKTAVAEVLDAGFTIGAPSTRELELAEALCARFPSMEMVQFTNSGTETNTVVIAMGLNYTNKKKVMVFQGGYHGGTLSFKTPNALILPHQFVMGVYNDVENTQSVLDADVGVILVEPMQGAGGLIPATRDFLAFLRHEATRIGAVLVFDEVITARTHYGGLQSYHGIIPDMTSIGKFFGGAFAFGAFGGRADIMKTLDCRQPNALAHSGTNNNNPFTMAAGLAACRLLTPENIERTNALGEKMQSELARVLDMEGPDTAIVRGFGSTVGVYFNGPRSEVLGRAWYYFLLARRIHAGPRGFFALNIMHQEQHVQQVLDAAADFKREVFGAL
ncbi:hypothetical protein CLAIMM_02448 [Cladophialophora immunda]|nr:hypothetical protein CLAIMM_02448 [Cladophialophora immunda]